MLNIKTLDIIRMFRGVIRGIDVIEEVDKNFRLALYESELYEVYLQLKESN